MRKLRLPRLRFPRPTMGGAGVGLVAAGTFYLFGIGICLLVVGAFFLLAEFLEGH